MAEENRMRMGLGPQGYHAQRFGFSQNYTQYFRPERLQPMQMHLTANLRTAYQPCKSGYCIRAITEAEQTWDRLSTRINSVEMISIEQQRITI